MALIQWKPTPEVWEPGALLWPPPPTDWMEAADWKPANVATSTSAPGEGGAAVASYTPLSSSFLCFFLLWFFVLKRQTVVAVSRRTKGALIGSALSNTACPLTGRHHNRIASYLAACHIHGSDKWDSRTNRVNSLLLLWCHISCLFIWWSLHTESWAGGIVTSFIKDLFHEMGRNFLFRK